MTRRDLIAFLGSTAAAWPMGVRAQQQERVRRVRVLMNVGESSAAGQRAFATFKQTLEGLGWSDQRNVQLSVRWAAGDPTLFHKYAGELVALEPDVVFAVSTPAGSHQLLRLAHLLDHLVGGREQREREGFFAKRPPTPIDDMCCGRTN